MVTSHRGEDGVRGVEAAGGVGAAEAPVRPPVQHLYSAVQCTPVQYSTVQHSTSPSPPPLAATMATVAACRQAHLR